VQKHLTMGKCNGLPSAKTAKATRHDTPPKAITQEEIFMTAASASAHSAQSMGSKPQRRQKMSRKAAEMMSSADANAIEAKAELSSCANGSYAYQYAQPQMQQPNPQMHPLQARDRVLLTSAPLALERYDWQAHACRCCTMCALAHHTVAGDVHHQSVACTYFPSPSMAAQQGRPKCKRSIKSKFSVYQWQKR
jgi:hypothetical protein